MFCELGGEFIDSSHADILALATELNLPVDDLRPGDTDLKPNIFISTASTTTKTICAPLALHSRRESPRI